MGYYIYAIQLQDLMTGKTIIEAGGKAVVVEQGGAAKVTLYDPDNDFVALANPITPTRGMLRFAVADTVESVDIYGVAPGGQAFRARNREKGAGVEIFVDSQQADQVLIVPVDVADYTAATEGDTGFTEPADAIIGPFPFVNVLTLDDTETLDVGTDSGDSGDADGFIDGVSVATAGVVKATRANSGDTMGELLTVQDSANSGDKAPEGHVSGEKAITVTFSDGSDTAAVLIYLPYTLAI